MGNKREKKKIGKIVRISCKIEKKKNMLNGFLGYRDDEIQNKVGQYISQVLSPTTLYTLFFFFGLVFFDGIAEDTAFKKNQIPHMMNLFMKPQMKIEILIAPSPDRLTRGATVDVYMAGIFKNSVRKQKLRIGRPFLARRHFPLLL